MRVALGFVLFCLALSAVLHPGASHAATAARAAPHPQLAPFERDAWPAFLSRLDLPAERDYALLIILPSAYPIDLTDADTARRSLFLAAGFPSSVAVSKAPIGHAMVGWQCGGRRGLVSKTGETDGQGTRMMLFGGWGITPLLSTFTDGSLMAIDDIPRRYRRQIAAGRANMLAVQVSRAECMRLRRHVADYIADPTRPAGRFSLLDRAGTNADGCTSFAVNALGRAGIFRGVDFRRRLTVYDGMIGRRAEAPRGVEPYAHASRPEREKIVDFPTLRAGPWTEGKVETVIEIVDPELVYAAAVALRRQAGAPPSWRESRALPAGDPAVRRVADATRRWAAAAASRARILDPAGLSMLVLER